jgi:hypothetical protein
LPEKRRFSTWHFTCIAAESFDGAIFFRAGKFTQNQKQSETKMKKNSQWLAAAGVAALMALSAGMLLAQDNPPPGGPGGRDRGGRGRGGFGGDPAEFRQRMMDNIREQFGVKDDAEWKIIEERVQKVMDTRREVGFGGPGMSRMFRRPGGDNNGGDRRRGFGPEPSAEEQALEKAIDSKASKEELKAAMAKYRAARKEKEARLTAAQEELKKVLNTQQEAVALSMGLVN